MNLWPKRSAEEEDATPGGLRTKICYDNVDRQSNNKERYNCRNETPRSMKSFTMESDSASSSNISDDSTGSSSSDSNDDVILGEINDEPRGMFSFHGINDNRFEEPVTMRPNVTTCDILSRIIALTVRHNLSYEAMMDIIKMIISVTNANGLPSTKNKLWETLLRNDNLVMIRHLYCRTCHVNVGKGNEPVKDCICGSSGKNKPNNSLSYFIQLNLEEQLRIILDYPDMSESLRYRYKREKQTPRGMEDIYDGQEYRKMCEPGSFLSYEYNYSFTINTDGCKVANSTNASAWPVLLTINELPPHARKRHMLLAGIWVDNKHPDLNMLLKPTAEELIHLYTIGITWKPNGVDTVTSKFVTLICSVDSIARPALLNMTQFNGKYGCTFCVVEGKRIGKKMVYPVQKDEPPLRTDAEMRLQMQEARAKEEKILGIIGRSIMMVVPSLNLANGVVVESMHSIFLGVTKQHTALLLFGKASDPWYRGSPRAKSLIDSRLRSVRIPLTISRIPGLVKDYKNWKASEWRNWLFYYGTVCMKGIIRESDLEHFSLLSRASYTCYRDSITVEELGEATKLIKKYVANFEATFGEIHMTFNVHLLTHLIDTVRNWGPLWGTNAFPFQSFNKKIIDFITSATARPLQIVTRFLMNRFIEKSVNDPNIGLMAQLQIEKIMKRGRKTMEEGLRYEDDDIDVTFSVIGKPHRRKPLPWELQCLEIINNKPYEIFQTNRVIVRGVEYNCSDTKKNTRRTNEFVFVKDIGFAEISHIVYYKSNNETVGGMFVECYDSLESATGAQQNILLVRKAKHRAFVPIKNIFGPAVIISNHEGMFAIQVPNIWETD